MNWSNLNMHGKTSKCHTKTINLKYQFQHGINHFIYLMDQILYQIFKIILNIYKQKEGGKTDNPSI